MVIYQTNAMELIKRTVGPWFLNAYAIVSLESGESLLVDPGAEPDVLHSMLAGTRCQAIVVTHGHPDHIGALEQMRTELKVPVLAYCAGSNGRSSFPVDRWINSGERLTLGRQIVEVVHTPGHTDDQICLDVKASPTVLVGDTIFEGGPGRTGSVKDFRKTMRTLRQTVLGWPDETVCYPGHGPSFCLGDRRRAIERFLKKDHGDFCGDATWEM